MREDEMRGAVLSGLRCGTAAERKRWAQHVRKVSREESGVAERIAERLGITRRTLQRWRADLPGVKAWPVGVSASER